MSDFTHVDPKLHALFEGPDIDRIRYILRDRYVPYQRAKEVLADVDELVIGERSERPLCALLVGEPGVGKSTLLDVVEKKYPPVTCNETKVILRPVVRINLPGVTEMRALYQRALKALRVPYGEGDRPSTLELNLHDSLSSAGTRVLAMDELHNFFIAGPKTFANNMAALRDLTNTPKVSLVCAGTELARLCIQADPQLLERFDQYEFCAWSESSELRNFLASWEWRLPLRRPSNLAGPIMLPLLLRLSTGHMRRMVRIIKRASKMAILSGDEYVTQDACHAAAQHYARGSLNAATKRGVKTSTNAEETSSTAGSDGDEGDGND
ncbi:AAA family ATPase [Dyella dinghuensis]|uniref:AAA family ATPase n=1 Tax=Dyella dinghuensis TaxID=1920169 RepID=A0A3S0WRQ9_9GAMM|nr:TniB family NTP-binding protein [Dyella dinghuensis]RUL66820.1 AAA family ATPase [Dyella dinghuensis]